MKKKIYKKSLRIFEKLPVNLRYLQNLWTHSTALRLQSSVQDMTSFDKCEISQCQTKYLIILAILDVLTTYVFNCC